MSPETISAIAKLMAAIAPIVGAYLVYDIRRRIVEYTLKPKSDRESGGPSFTDDHRFILYCILVYVTAGATTAAIGVLDNWGGRTASMYVESNLCWLIGNVTVFLMVLFRVIKNK